MVRVRSSSFVVYHELIVTTHHATYMFSFELTRPTVRSLSPPQKMIVIRLACLLVLLKREKRKFNKLCVCARFEVET